jgi:two-component system NtrC family sensor kinase
VSGLQDKLLAAFEAERKEHLAALRGMLAAGPLSGEADLHEAYRRVHSLKGAARIAGFAAVEALSLRLETLMGLLRSDKLTCDDRIAQIIAEALEAVERCAAQDDAPKDLLAWLEGLIAPEAAAPDLESVPPPLTHILIVEDSDTQAFGLIAVLEANHIAADRAASAQEALDYLSRKRPDLILVDFHLPGMRGDELCRQIRMNPATSNILLVMLTGDVDDTLERHGLESGADDHLPKTVDSDGLLARINALLRTRKRQPSPGRAASFFRRRCVVVVDDSPTYLEYLADALGQEGYDVKTFTEAESVLRHIETSDCDCMLVDLVMPGIDGIALCRRLDGVRGDDLTWFPLLMVTARDTKEDMMRALEAGADDFVSKSSDVAILRARIRAALRRKLQRDEHERIGAEFRAKELEVVRERTERESAERRAALAERLELTNRELKETQAQLIQAAKMASLGELVAGIAHEINNPLAYVMSHLDTVIRLAEIIDCAKAQETQLAKVKTRLFDMSGGLQRVRDLVVKLRTFSRLDEGAFKTADMHENIESVLAILHHRLQDGITVTTRYAEDNVIRCFPATLNQAIMNLVSNAIDALGGKGEIFISTERDEKDYRIIVADNGPGLAPDIRERIFEPFFTTKPVGSGMGLGLAITYRIIQAHKGMIRVEEREGGGARFAIAIPLDLQETSDVERDDAA